MCIIPPSKGIMAHPSVSQSVFLLFFFWGGGTTPLKLFCRTYCVDAHIHRNFFFDLINLREQESYLSKPHYSMHGINRFSTCTCIQKTEKLFWYVFDREYPKIKQMWQLLIEYIYYYQCSILIFCPIAIHKWMALAFIMCSTIRAWGMWAWSLFL